VSLGRAGDAPLGTKRQQLKWLGLAALAFAVEITLGVLQL
jgi:hypothetical protein